MQTLDNITRAIWTNRKIVNFGNSRAWNQDTFLKKWINQQTSNLWCNKKGWYWIECDGQTPQQFSQLPTPVLLPTKGIKFSEVATFNLSRFNGCVIPSTSCKIVYNGQADKIFSRIRCHFVLNNNTTAALGLKHYPLSQHQWKASFFHEDMIDELDLSDSEKGMLKILISNKPNREIIENLWRFLFGWSILSKK